MPALAAFFGNAFLILGAVFLSLSGMPGREVSNGSTSVRGIPENIKIHPVLRQEGTVDCAAYGCDFDTDNPELCVCVLEPTPTHLLRQARCDRTECVTNCNTNYPTNQGAMCRSGVCQCLINGSYMRLR